MWCVGVSVTQIDTTESLSYYTPTERMKLPHTYRMATEQISGMGIAQEVRGGQLSLDKCAHWAIK